VRFVRLGSLLVLLTVSFNLVCTFSLFNLLLLLDFSWLLLLLCSWLRQIVSKLLFELFLFDLRLILKFCHFLLKHLLLSDLFLKSQQLFLLINDLVCLFLLLTQ
jgi:hypothetical protein